MKRIARLFVVAAVALLVIATTGYTQTNTRIFTATISNICSSGVIAVSQSVLENEGFQDIATGAFTLSPGGTVQANFTYQSTGNIPVPSTYTVLGSFNGQEFRAIFQPVVLNQPVTTSAQIAGGCLQVLFVEQGQDDDGSPTPQPTDPDSKPIVGGESLEQTLNTLQANGFQVTQDGSESSPKLSNVNDPILLRGINAFSAQVVWVSAPGLLRTVITWDNPTTDLDLLVFGISACFQLNPAGFLAELCDRAPQGPVTGAVFAVVVINWSASSQQYTMSLST